jgi:hypothetical protein
LVRKIEGNRSKARPPEENDRRNFRERGNKVEDLIQLAQNKFQLWLFVKQ